MACQEGVIEGQSRWYASRDSDGHREYHIFHKLRLDDDPGNEEGPATAFNVPGLPLPGSLWSFGDDIDLQAVCQWDANVRQMVDERTKFYEIEQIFSTKRHKYCVGVGATGTALWNPADDPLNAPAIVTGNFVKYTEEKTLNSDGTSITNSAFERIRGQLAEFDASRLVIRIRINEATLGLPAKLALIDTINGDTMWGFGAGRIKLSNITWDQWYVGDCNCYYEVEYEFEMNENGFFRSVADEGTKALNGEWNKTTGVWDLININGSPPSPTNPTHFRRITDLRGNPMRVTLNGAGIPATTLTGTGSGAAGEIIIDPYPVSDFFSEIPGLPNSIEC